MATGNFSHSWLKNGSDPSHRSKNRRRKGIFEDILDERRREGELFWVLRSRQVPQFQFGIEPNSKSPADIKREVLASEKLLYGLKEISDETGTPVEELLKESTAIVDEMAHNLNMFTVRSFGYAVIKVMKSLYRGVYVNTDGMAQLRNACQQYPVILMPMHRSYADFMLMSLLCYDYDLPLPVIAAAMDFMGMRLIGSILRNCGAFFIRRSFATDRVYWLTFVEYVKTHVRDGLDPVEFFIEGTRSRTGKTLYPKTGMLGAILESWFMCEVPDVYLVPVSISYDRILEEKLYAYELLGVPKPKESTTGLLRARSVLQEDFGNVHFFVDEPISLRKFADAHGIERSVHSLMPKVKAELTQAESRMLKSVAHHAIWRQNTNAVVPSFALVASLLLSSGSSALPLAGLALDCDWLRRLLATLGASVDWPSGASPQLVVKDQTRVHGDLVRVVDNSWLAVVTDGAESLLDKAALQLRLASYRNQLVFHLAPAALLALANSSSQQQQQQQQKLLATYTQLERLFHREFVLEARSERRNYSEAWRSLVEAGAVVECDGDALEAATLQTVPDPVADKTLLLLRRLFLPFVRAYAFLLHCLLANRQRVAAISTERSLAAAVQAMASDWLARLPEVNRCYETLSLDLLTNAVHGLHHLKLVVKFKQSARPSHFDWGGLAQLKALLDSIVESELGQQAAGSSVPAASL